MSYRRYEDINRIPIHRLGFSYVGENISGMLLRSSGFRRGTETVYERRNNGESGRIRNLLRLLTEPIFAGLLLLDITQFILREKRNCSVIVCFLFAPFEAYFTLVARLTGLKVIARASSSGDYLFIQFRLKVWRRLIRLANAVVAISQRIKKDLTAEGFDEERIHTIPNAVIIPKNVWTSKKRSSPVAVFVGNLSQQPLKGIDVLIHAWRSVAKEFPTARLLICGGGDKSRLVELAGQLGVLTSVEFLGRIQDPESVVVKGSVFVLPSRVEGMSNALLEAMALGVPCIATDVSGSQDVIQHGINGLLVPGGMAEPLAKAIIQVFRDPKNSEKMGKEARRTVTATNSCNSMSAGYFALVKKVLIG